MIEHHTERKPSDKVRLADRSTWLAKLRASRREAQALRKIRFCDFTVLAVVSSL